MTRIHIYDTTLRDGSQGEGVNFSLQDKLLITRRLDELGVDFIEGGYPLSNPKDFEYFQEVRKLPLKHARVAAFGMTRRKNVAPAEDTCLKALLDAQAPVVTIVGKTWDLHVREVLGTTLEENLRMIADSVAYCQAAGPRGVLRRRALLRRLQAQPRVRPADARRPPRTPGPAVVILCDTNGGTLPEEIADGVDAGPRGRCACELGIHCHNDCDVAVANTLAAVGQGRDAGAGDDQRHRRALRQRRPGQRHRQPGPEDAATRCCSPDSLAAADGGVALRLRDRPT